MRRTDGRLDWRLAARRLRSALPARRGENTSYVTGLQQDFDKQTAALQKSN
ncbi:hypothetical protein [Bradyrhizobium sp. USDA 4452]